MRISDWSSDVCSSDLENGNADIVALLLEHGARVDEENRDGRTPLMTAAIKGPLPAVRTLIDAGADVTRSDSTGRQPLALARPGRSPQHEPPPAQAATRSPLPRAPAPGNTPPDGGAG